MKVSAYLIFFMVFLCNGQNTPKYNLDFEKQTSANGLADDWFQWGDYKLSMDSLSHSGQKSGKIEYIEQRQFGSIAYKIPANYTGERIELEGYMKINGVADGFAGLIMRIDGETNKGLAFNNMQNRNIQGTHDWEKYVIHLDYPEEAKEIFIGGILTGKGEAWFDNFTVRIDGKDIQTLKEKPKKVYKASLDKEFDKGSGIELSGLSEKEMNALGLLGKVWGFLKYHHPEIAAGNLNWDYELFRVLPAYIKASNSGTEQLILSDWITSIGAISPCNECTYSNEEAFIKPDLSWMHELEDELKDQLFNIYKNRKLNKHYYVGLKSYVQNPDFKNENPYADMDFPDDGFRLLSLFRYWNMIQYYFPYKHLIDREWQQILQDYIPEFIGAKNELEYELAVVQIIAEVKDTHANLWGGGNMLDELKGNYYPPFHLRFIEEKLVVVDYYNPEYQDTSMPQIGDEIVVVNGKPVEELLQDKAPYYPASNLPTRLRNMAPELLRASKDTIHIAFQNKEGTLQKAEINLYPKDSLKLYRWFRKSEERSYRKLENNIGYVTLETIKDEDISAIKEEFKDTKGIIIDIRNYPSTFVPFLLGSYFVSSPTPFVKFTTGSIENPGEFSFTKELEIPNEDFTYQGPLVVLVNEFTQSQAEYTTMAFQAGLNTTVIGSTTAGADGNVSRISLPGGLSTMISGIGVYYPDGRETQRIGIVPDIEVKPTIEGIMKGRDEVLERAVNFILKEF